MLMLVAIFGNVGGGGEADGGSVGGEIGAIWPKDDPKCLLGIGLSWTNSERVNLQHFLQIKYAPMSMSFTVRPVLA